MTRATPTGGNTIEMVKLISHEIKFEFMKIGVEFYKLYF